MKVRNRRTVVGTIGLIRQSGLALPLAAYAEDSQ
jgi:hypothetical protein